MGIQNSKDWEKKKLKKKIGKLYFLPDVFWLLGGEMVFQDVL